MIKGLVSHHNKFRVYPQGHWESVEGLLFEKITCCSLENCCRTAGGKTRSLASVQLRRSYMKPGGNSLQLSFFAFIHSSHLASDPFQPTWPGSASGKEPACQCRRHKRSRFNPWVRMISWRRVWQPTPVFVPGECHGPRSLPSYGPQGHKESDMIEAAQHTAHIQHLISDCCFVCSFMCLEKEFLTRLCFSFLSKEEVLGEKLSTLRTFPTLSVVQGPLHFSSEAQLATSVLVAEVLVFFRKAFWAYTESSENS